MHFADLELELMRATEGAHLPAHLLSQTQHKSLQRRHSLGGAPPLLARIHLGAAQRLQRVRAGAEQRQRALDLCAQRLSGFICMASRVVSWRQRVDN